MTQWAIWDVERPYFKLNCGTVEEKSRLNSWPGENVVSPCFDLSLFVSFAREKKTLSEHTAAHIVQYFGATMRKITFIYQI